MNPKILGKKIQQVREKCGFTQDAVEKALSFPQKALTRIESGQRQVSTFELAKLAELFHRPISDFFMDRNEPDEDLIVTLYRLAPGLEEVSKIREEVAKCVQICQEGAFLENLLCLEKRQRVLSYSFGSLNSTFEAISQGEQAAKDERRRLGIGNLPIYNIVELLSSQGIRAAATVLPDKMSGLFLHHRSLGMAILVNASHSFSRQRFSYAHEYAHALFDQNRNVLISASDNSSDLIEKRANAFAAAFLLPNEGIAEMIRSLGKGLTSRTELAVFDVATEGVVEAEERKLVSLQKLTSQDVALIANSFGVSYQATIYRLHSLRYLSQKEREDLLEDECKAKEYLQMLNLDEGKRNFSEQRELKAYISRLIIEAYRFEKISRGRLFELSKLLNLPGEKLIELAETEIIS